MFFDKFKNLKNISLKKIISVRYYNKPFLLQYKKYYNFYTAYYNFCLFVNIYIIIF